MAQTESVTSVGAGSLARADVGVAIALSSEARALAGRTIPPGRVFRVADNVVAVLSGIGAARAAAGAHQLLDAGARGLVSFGTAGGLAAAAVTGSLLLPTRILGPDGRVIATDPAWQAISRNLMAERVGVIDGHLIQSAHVVTRPHDKIALGAGAGALAVDMESFSIAEVAGDSNVPFSAVRVVADDSNGVVPEIIFGINDAFGRPRWVRLAARLLHSPHSLPALRRMGQAFGEAYAVLSMVGPLLGPCWARRMTHDSAGGEPVNES